MTYLTLCKISLYINLLIGEAHIGYSSMCSLFLANLRRSRQNYSLFKLVMEKTTRLLNKKSSKCPEKGHRPKNVDNTFRTCVSVCPCIYYSYFTFLVSQPFSVSFDQRAINQDLKLNYDGFFSHLFSLSPSQHLLV